MAKKLRDEGFSEEAIQQFKIDQNKKDVEMICEHCGSKYM
jgi:redox-regulated HSP33 family molecular chaperone